MFTFYIIINVFYIDYLISLNTPSNLGGALSFPIHKMGIVTYSIS